MRDDAWPLYCRSLLVASVASAARQFPGRGEQVPERVHGVRKTLKEARAIARFFLPSLGEPARVTIAALAVVRRRIGRARDLDVMEGRLARLAPPPEIAAPLVEAIGRERAAAGRAHGGLATSASRAQLNAVVKRLEAWGLNSLGADDIVEAVARTYRQARRRGRIAFDGDDPAALHALRARVVDLRYQLAALSLAWPAALNAQSEELNALRDTLGGFNDLHVLATFATERASLEPEALAGLMARLSAKQKKLRRRAETEFDRLFAETPDAFAERLSAYLRQPMAKPKAGAPNVPVKAKGPSPSAAG
jgi:CHAD domain-containing protein